MNRTIIILAVGVIAILSCRKQVEIKEANYERIAVDVEKIDAVKFSSFRSSYKIIRLETLSESLIKDINRIIVYGNKFFIFDKAQKSIFIFSEEGKFIDKILSIGKGPGEYMQISDFTIDTLNSQIVVSADRPYKFMYYSLEGNFIREESSENRWFKSISSIGGHLVLYNRSSKHLRDDYKIYFKEPGKKGYNKFLPYERGGLCGIVPSNQYLNQSRSLYFIEPYNDTVYRVEEHNISPIYYIDFGDKKLPKEVKQKLNNIGTSISSYQMILGEDKYVYNVSNFRETNNYIFFMADPFYQVIYSKKEKRSYVYKFFNDDITGLPVNIFAHSGTDNTVINIIEPGFFKNFLNLPHQFGEQFKDFPELKRKYIDVDKMDNPLLVIYTLK
jgi:hypothetical protein